MLNVTFSIITSYINASLAFISNSILICLIITKTPRNMCNYRHLMLIFSIFGIIFAFIDGTNQPMLHFYNGAYVIFSRNVLGLPRHVSFWYIGKSQNKIFFGEFKKFIFLFSALNCTCYSMIMLLLVFHFLYRYLAVCKPNMSKLFSFPYVTILILIFVFVSAEWLVLGVYMASENEIIDEHIR